MMHIHFIFLSVNYKSEINTIQIIRVVDVAGACLSTARSLLDVEITSTIGSVNGGTEAAIRSLLVLTKDQIR